MDLNSILGLSDARSLSGIFSRGRNVYNGGSMSANRGQKLRRGMGKPPAPGGYGTKPTSSYPRKPGGNIDPGFSRSGNNLDPKAISALLAQRAESQMNQNTQMVTQPVGMGVMKPNMDPTIMPSGPGTKPAMDQIPGGGYQTLPGPMGPKPQLMEPIQNMPGQAPVNPLMEYFRKRQQGM